jgi:hypothetical protein
MNTGKVKGADWVALPIGILAGGVELEARRPVSFQVIHPLTGQVVAQLEKARGERFTLARGPGAYVLRGVFTDVPGSAARVSVDLGAADRESGLSLPQNPDGDTAAATAGGRDCRRNADPAEDLYFLLQGRRRLGVPGEPAAGHRAHRVFRRRNGIAGPRVRLHRDRPRGAVP